MRKALFTLMALCGLPAASSAGDVPILAEPAGVSPTAPSFYAPTGPADLIPDARAAIGLGGARIAGGVTYPVVFDSTDRAPSRFRLDEASGAVGQVGADVMLTERVGVSVDVKKPYLRPVASGRLAGLPVRSVLRLDPAPVPGGVVVRV